MKTILEELEDKFFVTLDGDMDTAAAVEAEEILKPLYTSKGKDVVIDCTHLDYIASSGLRILIRILKSVKAGKSQVTLRGVNKDILNVLTLTGFLNLFILE
jgi:anti-anti-sigma factor